MGFSIFLRVNGRQENLLKLIIGLEIIILGIGVFFVHSSILLDDIVGINMTLLLLPLAGAESAIALALYIGYYPMRGTIIKD
jgi:NADH:ubiquinone oxidoreductase subunit K